MGLDERVRHGAGSANRLEMAGQDVAGCYESGQVTSAGDSQASFDPVGTSEGKVNDGTTLGGLDAATGLASD